jgi:hypothetical protein
MKWKYLFFCFLLFQTVYSQNISAYSDYRNYFCIFDNGVKKEIEYTAVKSFKCGRTCIAFVDNSGTLKIYYKGIVSEMLESTTEYLVSKYLILGKLNSQLKVFDNGEMTTLSKDAGSFAMGDSLIAFNDKMNKKFNAYYNGEIIQLEDLLVTDEVSNFKTGSNIIAYVNDQNDFKLFYHGVLSKLLSVNSAFQFGVGLDIVAYNNIDDLSFNVFYKNEYYKIEDFNALSYIAGNACVAYVDNSGIFKLFKEGDISTISNITPDFYKVIDDLIIYSEQNFFKVFYKNKSYLLENFIPSLYKYDLSSVAYIDKMGNLKLFHDGKTETITYEKVKSFDLNGNLLTFTTGNDNKFYLNGKLY